MVCCSIKQQTQSVVSAVQEALQAAQQQVERLQDERSSSGAQAAAKVDAAMERARQQVHTRQTALALTCIKVVIDTQGQIADCFA